MEIILDQTGDGGDSCNFTCFKIWCDLSPKENIRLIFLFWNNGSPVRHPTQFPWNNPKNFTRDQAIPLLKVLPQIYCRRFFFKIMRRGFFMPNIDRDEPGSRKYPWPHKVKPNLWQAKPEWRLFDFCDWAGPSFIGYMILRANIGWLKWYVPIGRFFCKLSIHHYCKGTKSDFKQLFLEADEYGLAEYFSSKRNLAKDSFKYFVEDRNLREIHSSFMDRLFNHQK